MDAVLSLDALGRQRRRVEDEHGAGVDGDFHGQVQRGGMFGTRVELALV